MEKEHLSAKEFNQKYGSNFKDEKGKQCKQCGNEFTPKSHGGIKQFCSYRCARL